MQEHQIVELPNGIRVVHRQVTNTSIAHCAIMLDIGSRDENENQQGIAHFWEHMAFKGTKKRKAYHIINRLESLGGELNAYTTKEKICFYAAVLDDHLDKAVELLSDITFKSTFPDHQIDKERLVILEEMSMYRDNPEDSIQDDLDIQVFANHQMGNNILGTQESVSRFQKEDFLDFLSENIDTNRIVFSSVGKYSMKKLLNIINKYITKVEKIQNDRKRVVVNGFSSSSEFHQKDLTQAHVGLGQRAFDIRSEEKVPFFLLNSILGGHSMNSRLNMSLREKNGLVYGIESNYQAFTDTGMFSIFYATESKNVDKSLALIQKEFVKMREVALGSKQLQTAKDQIKGQMAMSEENNQSFMLMMAKSVLDYDKIESLESMFAKIDKVTAKHLRELANQMLSLEDMCMLQYNP